MSATPDGSNAPTSPTPSNTASPPAPSTVPETTPTAIAPEATPGAPTPAAGTPAAGTPTAPTPAAGGTPVADAGVDTPTTGADTTGTEALEMMESPMATPMASPEAGFICFPGDSTVELESGSVKRMDEVVVGDRVAVGSGKFSEVFMFTHKLSDVKQDFVSIKTASGETVRLTEGHYLPVNGKYVPAREAKVGDFVTVASGATTIAEISTVSGTGLFNPQTAHGDIVVDGVLASTYTTAVERKMAHAMLAPFRMLAQQLGLTTAMLNSGNDFAARFTSVFA